VARLAETAHEVTLAGARHAAEPMVLDGQSHRLAHPGRHPAILDRIRRSLME
jgi:hypothetical protein